MALSARRGAVDGTQHDMTDDEIEEKLEETQMKGTNTCLIVL
jgi:hypothetical protein